MLTVTVTMSNEAAEAADRELKAFLRYATDKMVGERNDRRDTATPAYVVLRAFSAKLEQARALASEEAQAAERSQRGAERSIRSIRRS